MKVLTAEVQPNGQLEVPPGLLSEGQVVTILVHEGGEQFFDLSEAEETALVESAAQVERGECVDGWELLRELETRNS